MPEWVDTAFQSKSGVLELKAFLVKNAGVRFLPDGQIVPKQLPDACFKTNSVTTVDQVVAARGIVTACAAQIVKGVETQYQKLPPNPAELRLALLRREGVDCVDFPRLLEACWEHGVPVLYLPALPIVGRKMDGMVTYVNGRPVIILTKKVPHPDWLLFVLAHEMGHLACGHLPEAEGHAIVDDTVDVDGGNERDQQENEANQFATRLLADGGREVTLGRLPNAERLARLAEEYGREHAMAPGYVILNAVHNTRVQGKKPYALGQAALKVLKSSDTRDVAMLCRDQLKKNVNIDFLRDDSVYFLEKMNLL